MDQQQLAFLRQRYARDSWPPVDGNNGELVEPALEKLRLDGWKLLKTDHYALPEGIQASFSVWEHGRTAGPVLAIDILGCTNAAAAQDYLLELLGEFQSPLVVRKEPPPAGEIAFAPPGQTAVIFRRANLVVMIRNAGRELVSVDGPALEVDQHLILTRGQKTIACQKPAGR